MSPLTFLTLLSCLAPAVEPAPASEDPELTALAATTFEPVDRLDELPPAVRKGLEEAIGSEPIAEAGADWNSGCIKTGSLPGRRFIFAGKSPARWVVFFESGGRGHSYRVVTLRGVAGGAFALEAEWFLPGQKVTTLAELKNSVRAAGFRRRDPAAKPRPKTAP
jgi:hypothetical protein